MNKVSQNKADGFICFHNHPGGNTEPSPTDLSMVRTLSEVSKLYEITCIDNFIIADGNINTNLAEMSRVKEYESNIKHELEEIKGSKRMCLKDRIENAKQNLKNNEIQKNIKVKEHSI